MVTKSSVSTGPPHGPDIGGGLWHDGAGVGEVAEDAGDAAWAVSQLQPQSASSFTEAVRSAAWRDRPSTYVVCEQDQAIPLFAQEAMSRRARDVFRLDAGHSPFLSQPAEVVKLLAQFA